jgi:hypothetical protein
MVASRGAERVLQRADSLRCCAATRQNRRGCGRALVPGRARLITTRPTGPPPVHLWRAVRRSTDAVNRGAPSHTALLVGRRRTRRGDTRVGTVRRPLIWLVGRSAPCSRWTNISRRGVVSRPFSFVVTGASLRATRGHRYEMPTRSGSCPPGQPHGPALGAPSAGRGIDTGRPGGARHRPGTRASAAQIRAWARATSLDVTLGGCIPAGIRQA